MSVSVLTEVELGRVAEVLVSAGEEVVGPVSATPISGGRSNITLCLEDGSSRWVLRMPPRVGRTPSAHDVAREHRVTSALHRSGVPVARAVVLCQDESVLGSEFAVAAFVEGRTIQRAADLDQLDAVVLDEAMHSIVDTLAALHRVNHVAVGLERLGRPTGYAARQLATWSHQWELVGVEGLEVLEGDVRGRLEERVPEQSATSVVHGDYRIDNTMLDPQTNARVVAVVDWELSTIGDPVADVATMVAYRHPAFDFIVGEPSAWTSPRLPKGDGLAEMYAAAGGPDLEHWQFHLALAHYKIAVIAAGIERRRLAGSGSGAGFDTSGDAVEPYLAAALDLAVARR